MSWGERLEGLDDRVFCGRCSQAILEQCQLSLLSGQGTFILSFLVNSSNDFKKSLLTVIVE